jgi:DNA-binding protein H-NS
MAYSIRLPDGTLVENIPDDLSPEEAKKRIVKAFPQFAPPTSVTRRVLGDVPVGIAQGATTGIRMIADAFGADNAVSQSLKGAEEYLGGLLSAQATNNLDAMAKILKEAEDKGVLDQVKAGAQALAEAPVEVVSQFLGTAAPTILAGVGGVMARLGATGIGALQAGTGATMGAGLIKGNIYEVVKEELTNAGVDPKIAEERAKFAQNYTGENWDQILLGTGLGAAAALGPLERIFARVPAIPTGLAAKNMVTRGVAAGVMEAAPEATQAFQEQVAANIALQREGFDVPTFRGAVANATLEGLAGFGVGAPIGMMSRRQKVGEAEPGAEQRAEETKQTQEGIDRVPATPPTVAERPQEEGLLPGMVQPEPELTPEDEAELQARIAGAAPPAAPPAGIAPILPPGPPPAPAPTGVPIPTEAAPPVAAPEPQAEQLEMLNAQLAQIQQARMDPTLSIDDYETIGELDRRETEIVRQIQALTPQPPVVPAPVEQLPEIDNVSLQQLQPSETVSVQQPAPVVAPPVAPTITPPPAVTPQVVPPVEAPTEVRDQRTVQTELNRVRQSLRQMETAVKRGQMPESEVTRLQDRVNALEQELEEAKPGKRVPVFRSKEGNTWTGTGNAPAWLRKKFDQGMDLEDFRIRPELDNKSEDEIGEMEKPYGFGRPMPETRPPKELEDLIAQSEEARKESPNLFNMLRGKITPEDVEDITPEANLNFLKAPRGRGRDLSDVVNDGTLDAFLEVPHDAPNFDLTEATEFIKDLLRQDFKEDPTLMMSQETRAQLEYFGIKISELEAELEPEDVNRELQAVYAEERAIAQETEAAALEEQERGPAVPTGPPEFALEGETLDQARARTERAEAEREEFERRRVADLERDVFALQPTPAAPPPAAPPPAATGDLFGAAGMADQPPRTAPTVAPTPIEAEAAKIPPIEEAIEAELKKAGYDDLDKMSKQIKDEFGVSKPVADAYARAVQNARIQHIRAQYGEITAEQLMEALNTRDSLRRRIDGIVKRLKSRAAAQAEAEPKKEEKPSIRPTREIAEGTVVERIELPDNLEIRIVKLKDGYSVYQYDLDADEIVFGQQRQFRAPAFPKDRDAYRAADAYADEMYDQIVPKMAPGELKKFVDQKLSRGKDVINNKTPDPDIPPDQRLVLMSCCATKKGRAGEAMELYTGVFFQTFKNKVRPDAMPNVRILSAKYGFLKPDQRITTYDQTMNEETANQFLMGDNLVEGFPSNIKDVLIVGSNEYQRVMKAAIEDLIKEGKIDKDASINVTKGGIGEQRAQLGRYLAALRPAKEAESKKEPPAGPTFAGMQAEIDRVKAEAKAMGIDLDQQTFVRDEKAAKAEREAKKKKKEAKLVKQATRNEIEYARFDDLEH